MLLTAAAVALAACGGSSPSSVSPLASSRAGITTTTSSTLSNTDIGALADAFSDHPFAGGQTAPLFAKWASDDTFVFLQFDKPLASAAKAVAYLGVGVKGIFCAETRPDRAGSSFMRFQRYQAADWAQGAGGKPGDQGYWLSFLAVDSLNVDGRRVQLGIDYQYPAPAPPTCGARPAPVSFNPPGAGKPSPDAIGKIFAIFNEQPLQGGQMPPRVFKSLYEGVIAFAEFDNNSVSEAKEFHWIGIFKKASYCRSTQPTADFVHFHRLVAANYASGHGGPPGVEGFWGSWLTAERFQSQGRDVTPGIDREHNPTPAPAAC